MQPRAPSTSPSQEMGKPAAILILNFYEFTNAKAKAKAKAPNANNPFT